VGENNTQIHCAELANNITIMTSLKNLHVRLEPNSVQNVTWRINGMALFCRP